MPKEIDETKLSYNKYPGEHVVEFEGVVTIGGDKVFHIVQNFREGFNAEKLEQRFSDVFDKYDYIVGDWGFEQLRLKGFFSTSRKKMDATSKIDHLEDYLNEFCNFGAPYFVLRRIRTKEMRKKEGFKSERAFEDGERQPRLDKPRRRRSRNRNKNRETDKTENVNYEIREKKDTNVSKNKPNKQNRTSNLQKKGQDFPKGPKAEKQPEKNANRKPNNNGKAPFKQKRTTDKGLEKTHQKAVSTDKNKPANKQKQTRPDKQAKQQTQTNKPQGFVIRKRDNN